MQRRGGGGGGGGGAPPASILHQPPPRFGELRATRALARSRDPCARLRRAGKNPKTIPIAVLTPSATASAVGSSLIGQPNAREKLKMTPYPSALPTTPPSVASTSASSRNCSRMSISRAPMAIRMPISRVRSVTLTSMMFMTPMPPDDERHRRDADEQRRERREDRVLHGLELRLAPDGEVVLVILADVVPLAEDRLGLQPGALRRLGRRRAQQRWREPPRPRGDDVRSHRGDGHQHDLVLALSEGRRPFSSSTPSTRYIWRPIRTIRPTGSSDPNRSRAVWSPDHDDLLERFSEAGLHGSPCATFQLRISK